MTTYIAVDGSKCQGHAHCYLTAAPSLLEGDDEGYVSISGSRLEVPEDQLDAARSAVLACPESAITIVEEN